jgi:probable H4MPT-linked C1 transfer pathway protein
MPKTILGLDIGGANLKVATPDKRAISVPFALWKQPDKLPASLAELVAKFPDVEELAVTMTGELCDCYETKREGVSAIIKAVRFASGGRRIRVWSTDGVFLNDNDAKLKHLKVASANWYALATFVGRYVRNGPAWLIDIGSTTTDVVPILDGRPIPQGRTDPERLACGEMLYTGIRRTPVIGLFGVDEKLAAELFATTLDVYLHLGLIAENPDDKDTADGRPATRDCAFNRLCRMFCADRETVAKDRIDSLANDVVNRQKMLIETAVDRVWSPIQTALFDQKREPQEERRSAIVAGSGEFLITTLNMLSHCDELISLTDQLGPTVSACAPAYAIAVLATEMKSS